jgi:hypothetical protein
MFILNQTIGHSQNDSTRENILDSFLLKQKGIIGQLAQNLYADTTDEQVTASLQRNDKRFQRYRNRIIRNITVKRLEFGTPINDTSKSFKNKLTTIADFFHYNTRQYVIKKNLFFKTGDRLLPFLIADNEKHLRDLDYLQDAKITMRPVKGTKDSVDVFVLVKDVLSIGGNFRMHNISSVTVGAKEDDFLGWGDRFSLRMLYDNARHTKFGTGAEYIARNIAGSFIDGYAGVLNFENAFNSGRDEESSAYIRFIKPLVNPYMRWTYAVESGVHRTRNMYLSDSLYEQDFRYEYNNFDAWAAWNMSADKIGGKNEDNRLRRLISARYLHQKFQQVPLKYKGQYFYNYADLTSLLGSVSFFKQNFFKTQYIYGFGRNEDVPEGIDISLSAGWTKKDRRQRPYIDVGFQRYYFTQNENYFNFTVRAGTYLYHKKLQDMNVLFNLDYFSRLKPINSKWKNRNFISAGIARQFNEDLNEPLFLQSQYGLQEYKNDRILGGDLRATVKTESVYFSPWSFLHFRFAPFAFGNISWIRPTALSPSDRKIYSSIGAGVRTRNESLVFGTIELKGFYFPGKNYYNKNWEVQLNTNVKFKYNRQLIKRPELIQVN